MLVLRRDDNRRGGKYLRGGEDLLSRPRVAMSSTKEGDAVIAGGWGVKDVGAFDDLREREEGDADSNIQLQLLTSVDNIANKISPGAHPRILPPKDER